MYIYKTIRVTRVTKTWSQACWDRSRQPRHTVTNKSRKVNTSGKGLPHRGSRRGVCVRTWVNWGWRVQHVRTRLVDPRKTNWRKLRVIRSCKGYSIRRNFRRSSWCRLKVTRSWGEYALRAFLKRKWSKLRVLTGWKESPRLESRQPRILRSKCTGCRINSENEETQIYSIWYFQVRGSRLTPNRTDRRLIRRWISVTQVL